jgi:sensor histidine kinase YesM
VAEGTQEARVPALILQPLIENAIRHGVALRSSGGRIAMAIWREGDRLRLRVRDNGPGLPPGWDPERDLGIGLSNTRERLRQLYGVNQSFTVRSAPEGGVEVDIVLPYREMEMRPEAGRADPQAAMPAITAAAGASARARSGMPGS